METYCGVCRKTYEDVADVPCSAAVGTEHLRGGPIGVRAKRSNHGAVATAPMPIPVPQPVAPQPVERPVPVAVPQPVAAAVPAVIQISHRPRRRPVRPSKDYTQWMLPFVVDATLTG